MTTPAYPRTIGRYVINAPIASGGMATIHLGRMVGPVGFSRLVAIKRLHEHLANDPEFVQMFLDEARIAARIQHPNVVSTLDIVELENELFLVMDYVQGESLSFLTKKARNHDQNVPPGIAVHTIVGVLHGLHAAHEAKDEKGEPLNIIHRDVTPQNILIGVDGVPRIADFGIATAAGRLHHTREGQIKGKVQYMAPEQLTSKPTDRRCDIYAAAVVLWETLTGQKLFSASTDAQVMYKVLEGKTERPSAIVKGLPLGLDAVILRGLQRDPSKRYASAQEMAVALEKVIPPVPASVLGAWVREFAADALANAAAHIQVTERTSPNERALALAQSPRVHSPSLPTAPALTPAMPPSPPVVPPSPPVAEPLPPPVPELESAPPLPPEPPPEDLVLEELPPPGVAAPLDAPPLEAPPQRPPPPSSPAPPTDLLTDELAQMDISMAAPQEPPEPPAEEPSLALRPPPRHRTLVLGVLASSGLLLLGGLAFRAAPTEPPTAALTPVPPVPATSALEALAEPPVATGPASAPLADPPPLSSARSTPSASPLPAAVTHAAATTAPAPPVNKPKKPKNKLYSRD